jgi:hypothetical protein
VSAHNYRRTWSAPTAAGKPQTLSVYTYDLIGDHGICVLVTGMNQADEHTLTIFRKNSPEAGGSPAPFTLIADIRIDGVITVRETARTEAYQRGIASGQSFTISAHGRDASSSNLLDQIEITYSYNPAKGLYEQSGLVRTPSSQIELRRLNEIMSGGSKAFEQFIDGLWYFVGPNGTLDSRQYIYFDPESREIIFYGDESQQIFVWEGSSATRYGLYIASHNLSITTLRRFLDLEIVSLESIRVSVEEDVLLKILLSNPWNGTYRKAGMPADPLGNETSPVTAHIDAVYSGSIGRLSFSAGGGYTLESNAATQTGQYSFFYLEGRELLELKPDGSIREVYLVGRTKTEPEDERPAVETLVLTKVRIGTNGIVDQHEAAVSLSPVG